jgi:hypothetical protein
MAESVAAWWRRRARVTGAEVPYEVGRYREAWARYPVLQRQYHPELNAGVALSQIPPVAEVLVLWQCDVGHLFAATPGEQRARPGATRERRRSTWCPECLSGAVPRSPRPAGWRPPAPAPAPTQRSVKPRWCELTPDLPRGEPFASRCAPAPSSAVEAELRHGLHERLAFDPAPNAVRLARPFFDHLEAWPDILLPELRVAVEYDSTGRHGLEHVGPREAADRRKDRLLRSAGWEVVRVRTGRLLPLGPHDVVAGGVTRRLYPRILDALRDIRGPLLVDAYLR